MQIGKFELDQEHFSALEEEDQRLLTEYLGKITQTYFVGKNATLWIETEKIQDMLDRLPPSEITHKGQPIQLETLIRTIFDAQAATVGVRHIIIDEHIDTAENWIYKDLGVWIITYNFYITALYMVFVQKQWDADPLLQYAQTQGFTVDTKV